MLTYDLIMRITKQMEYEKWSPQLLTKRLTKETQARFSQNTIYK